MITRTSNIGMQQNALSQLMSAQNKLFEIQNQAYTQKKVNTLSDNPTEIATIMNLNQQLSQIGSYYSNITKAQEQFDNLDNTFNAVNTKLNRINDLGLQLLNGTGSAATVSATKTEIDQLIESVVDEANANYNGQYVFSGAKVQKQAYEIQRDNKGIVSIRILHDARILVEKRIISQFDQIGICILILIFAAGGKTEQHNY